MAHLWSSATATMPLSTDHRYLSLDRRDHIYYQLSNLEMIGANVQREHSAWMVRTSKKAAAASIRSWENAARLDKT
ncbi:hypothetical protein GJ744_006730 [Endocarpon pusillum]|uniref:Uncharacterized protein n=1 Tax=Endocarpon pusillum TaxID=364733 RepID=A0A8H7ANR5_9EURO|nr:hypothetical protein GJ744_006730 [Endocarpon pusillum]